MSVSREKRLDRAQMRVLFSVPFFAPGVAKLPVRFIDRDEAQRIFGAPQKADDGSESTMHWTACTDGASMLWYEGHFDRCADQELCTVICHEVCHCLLGHVWRAPGGVDWQIWNQACDHAVNNMLKEFSAQVTAKQLADPFPFPDPKDAYCANPAFGGMPEEKIYQILANQAQKKPPGGLGSGSGAGKGGKGKAGNQPGQGAPSPGQAQGKPGPGSMPSFGQIMKPHGAQADPAAQQKTKTDWEHTLMQSHAMAKGRGNVPVGMDRFVNDLIHPAIPWWEYVAQWLREHAEDDWDFMRPNPLFAQSEFLLPSLNSERIGEVVFAKDTSGSIDQDALKHFNGVQQEFLDTVRPRKLVDICCDSAVHRVKEYSPGDQVDQKAPGGGGTDFRPVFDLVGKRDTTPRCLVYLTDLDGTFPSEDPGYPVLWVTYGTEKKAPFGESVPIK